jgi:hypothetical protein
MLINTILSAIFIKCQSSLPFKLPNKLQLTNGIANLKQMDIKAPPGQYQVEIGCRNLELEVRVECGL